MWRFCLYVMVSCSMYACALPENPSMGMDMLRKRETSYRYCGNHLYTALRLACGGNYYEDEYKRNSDDAENKVLRDTEWIPMPTEYELQAEFPFRSRQSANSFTSKYFRRHLRSGGIADECCHNKGCTFSELREYCQRR
ncbi:hypothetical protein L9F63_003688 [Diploptera punctata]|uniref:Insulin-like domain-containing protein n=1 Tax=Diploptera punctata TaxID=6984 RepID=A0AAD8E9E3_DIPPU|nr:hypothetical protein L9F63_003688 [Diploptera punctata]